jgi:hypothetical protein
MLLLSVLGVGRLQSPPILEMAIWAAQPSTSQARSGPLHEMASLTWSDGLRDRAVSALWTKITQPSTSPWLFFPGRAGTVTALTARWAI